MVADKTEVKRQGRYGPPPRRVTERTRERLGEGWIVGVVRTFSSETIRTKCSVNTGGTTERETRSQGRCPILRVHIGPRTVVAAGAGSSGTVRERPKFGSTEGKSGSCASVEGCRTGPSGRGGCVCPPRVIRKSTVVWEGRTGRITRGAVHRSLDE